MSVVLFIRHGQTDMAGYFCGHADPELNKRGRIQAGVLAEQLAAEPIVRIYSSDLRRAQQTADALARKRALAVETRTDLREINFGQWEGRRWEEIEALDPEYAAAWVAGYPNHPAPSGERFQAFTARVMKEVHSLIEEGHNKVTAVVTHAGVLRVVLTQLLGCPEADAWAHTQPYCSVVRYASAIPGETQ